MSPPSMSFLSMVEAELPPGFRFHPRDDELVCDYLAPKLTGKLGFFSAARRPPMLDVDLNKVEPWELPAAASVGPREWYFFSLKDRKYATGHRTNRATVSGYWKATGKDRAVARRGALVGMRKTLVFYQGRAPKGRKTEWVMHEYRTVEGHHQQSPNSCKDEDWVLCRVICKKKSALGGAGATSNNKPARGVAAATGHDNTAPPPTTTTSPPLPPLMDTTLAQLQAAAMTTAAGAGPVEQVPCFSSFNNSIASTSVAAGGGGQPCYLPMVTGSYLDHGQLPELGSCYNDHLNSDRKLLKAVLSQLGGEVVPSMSPDMAAAASSTWMSHF